jgi:hypothetical protein
VAYLGAESRHDRAIDFAEKAVWNASTAFRLGREILDVLDGPDIPKAKLQKSLNDRRESVVAKVRQALSDSTWREGSRLNNGLPIIDSEMLIACINKESARAIDRQRGGRNMNPPKDTVDDTDTSKPTASSKHVQLFGPGEQPKVKGKLKPALTVERYNTVQALIQAGDKGLTKDKLDEKSGHTEARKALADMVKKDRDWKAVIVMPGETGKRYRIR